MLGRRQFLKLLPAVVAGTAAIQFIPAEELIVGKPALGRPLTLEMLEDFYHSVARSAGRQSPVVLICSPSMAQAYRRLLEEGR